MTHRQFYVGFTLATLIFVAFSLLFLKAQPVQGSAVQGNDYSATSTGSTHLYGASVGTAGGSMMIKLGQGSLSSVVITGANSGVFNLYDATTTNINLRTGNTASSSILLASFPASVATGDYVLDVTYTSGLLIDLISGVFPTSTVTYR